ncbi:MAG: hypothetical protein U0903_05565 [Planctomycetales bacterium]
MSLVIAAGVGFFAGVTYGRGENQRVLLRAGKSLEKVFAAVSSSLDYANEALQVTHEALLPWSLNRRPAPSNNNVTDSYPRWTQSSTASASPFLLLWKNRFSSPANKTLRSNGNGNRKTASPGFPTRVPVTPISMCC